MADYLIGVDIGTGSTKAIAIDVKGNILDSSQVHYPTLNPLPHYCEQPPELIWQAFVKCISRITSARKSPALIVLSSAMHSVIPCDEQGNALANMITWADNRSMDVAARIRKSSSGEMLYEETGTPIHAMSPLSKLIWLREHQPELFNTAYKFISIKEYIWFKLFQEFAVDISIASATGMMDIHKSTWSKNALALIDISEERVSRLVSTTYQRRNCPLASLLGIDTSTAFVMGASDGCLANVGSLALADGVAALTVGTSGAIRIATPTPIQRFKSMLFNYRLDEETFICGGPTNNGGEALRWYAERLLGKSLHNAEDYAALIQPLSGLQNLPDELIFLPYLQGERAPIWNSNASGVFFGMRSHHAQANFTQAVLEGIAMALFDIAHHMVGSGIVIRNVHVSGGIVRSAHWLQILANVFNAKMTLLNADDASAIGACYLGLKTAGIISAYSSLKPVPLKEVLPDKEVSDRYRLKFKRYRKLQKQLDQMMS